jgi:hypothetical protein
MLGATRERVSNDRLVLRCAFEAGRSCAGGARRAFADAKGTIWELALIPRLGAYSGRTSRNRARVAGREVEGPEQATAEQGCSDAG